MPGICVAYISAAPQNRFRDYRAAPEPEHRPSRRWGVTLMTKTKLEIAKRRQRSGGIVVAHRASVRPEGR